MLNLSLQSGPMYLTMPPASFSQDWLKKENGAKIWPLKKCNGVISTIERLEQETQVVLDMIENPDMAQALGQDKNQNLQYLEDHYNVCHSVFLLPTSLSHSPLSTAHPGLNYCPLQLWSVPISLHIAPQTTSPTSVYYLLTQNSLPLPACF